MPWLRLWVDILDSVKIHDLSDDLYRGWTMILLATKRDNRGDVVPPIKKIAFWSHRDAATIQSWLDQLERLGFLDRDEDGLHVHDWEYWQEPKDRTNASRQKRHRDGKKTVPPGPPPEEKTNTRTEAERTVTPPPLRNTPSTPLRNAVTPECQAVINLAAERWGASNGDAVVGDLLKTFPPDLVRVAMDKHFDKRREALNASLLRGTCQGMFNDGWPPPPSKRPIPHGAAKDSGPTNQPRKPDDVTPFLDESKRLMEIYQQSQEQKKARA